VRVVPHVVRAISPGPSRAAQGRHALVAARLAPEKGVETAIDACATAGLPLVVAGDGPLAGDLRAHAAATGADVRFTGRVEAGELADLRAHAALALVPSRSAETFGLAAAEAMADGVPVAASAIGALPELLADPAALAPPGDTAALAAVARARFGDPTAGEAGRERIRALAAPANVAPLLAAVYDGPDPA
jgi:glycosyltransferase involved in cell wall biosynthesis